MSVARLRFALLILFYMSKTSSAGKDFVNSLETQTTNPAIENYLAFLQSNGSNDPDQWDAYINNVVGMQERELDYRRSLENQQRERDWSLADRAHQEAYDDPSQQLARLMATGMSRQAAMAMLSAGQTAMPNAANPASSAASPLSASGNAAANAQNAFALGLQGIEQVASLGMQLAQFPIAYQSQKSQLQLLQNQSHLSSAQKDAFTRVGDVGQMLYNFQLAHPDFEKPHSTAELAKHFASTKYEDETGALLNDYFGNQYQKDVRNPYFWSMAQDAFLSDNRTRGYQERELEAASLSRQVHAASRLAEVSLDEHLQNYNWMQDKYADYALVRDKFNEKTLAQLEYDLQELQTLNDPRIWKAKHDAILANEQYQYYAASLNGFLASEEMKAWTTEPQYKSLLRTSLRLDRIGFKGSVGDLIKGVAMADTIFTEAVDALGDTTAGKSFNNGAKRMADAIRNPNGFRKHLKKKMQNYDTSDPTSFWYRPNGSKPDALDMALMRFFAGD